MSKQVHGFTTREEWADFFSVYFEKLKEIERIFYSGGIQANARIWAEDYKTRSAKTRMVYNEYYQYLKEDIYYFIDHPERWEKATADSLLAYLFRFCTRFDDIEIAFGIAGSLMEYYEAAGEECSIMKCCLILIACYSFLDTIHFRNKILALCQRGKKLYKKHYHALSEEDKSMGLSLFDFECAVTCDFPDFQTYGYDYFEKVLYPSHTERMDIIDKFMKTADMTLELNKTLPIIRKNWINFFSALLLHVKDGYLPRPHIQILFEIAKNQYEEGLQSSSTSLVGHITNEIIYLMGSYLLGKEKHILDRLYALAKQIPKRHITTWQYYDDELINSIQLLAKAVDLLDAPADQKKKAAVYLLDCFHETLSLMNSSTYLEHLIGTVTVNYFIPLLKYIDDENEILLRLFRFTILRQPQTAIHTVVVCKIAACIIDSIVEEKPELLLGQLSCKTAGEIRLHRAEFAEYIQKAAFLHDTGKILCTNVINMQYRKLIPVEFEAIKFHPVTSYEIISQIPALSAYKDSVLGHHKSFDGKSGYPEEFDKLKSSKQIFIDLLSICDSLEAATDAYGRNYASPKNLEMILRELQEGKGTRYSPELVSLLCHNERLQRDINAILTDGRENVYNVVYNMVKQ